MLEQIAVSGAKEPGIGARILDFTFEQIKAHLK